MPFSLDDLLRVPPFSLPQAEKEEALLPFLNAATRRCRAACPGYRKIVDALAPHGERAASLAEAPFLPVSLFKHRRLSVLPEGAERTVLASSGTTGQTPSRVPLDAATARLTAQTLAHTLKAVIGEERLPLLLLDAPAALGGGTLSARAAALLGIMPQGRDPCFALRDDGTPDAAALESFLARHRGAPLLLYGFTFLIWQNLLPFWRQRQPDFSCATLLHSGGWKALQDQAVDNAAFRRELGAATGLAPSRIVNFYGMAEAPGTIFVENEDGLFTPPAHADVLIRDPVTLAPLPPGRAGVVQILDALPRSYPGHALLTEDRGVIETVDSGVNGRMGAGLRLLGRVPRAERRGCGDVLAAERKAA